MTQSFVAIELLAFSVNIKFHFYCSRELSVLGINSIYSLRKNYWFFCFLCIYRKQNILWNVHTYIQRARHFAKSKNICVTFLFTKIQTLYVTQYFMKYIYIYIMTRCVTWGFYIQKAKHSEKSKTICVTFFNTKNLTLCVTQFFMEFLKLAEGEGHFYKQKIMQFALHFVCKKQYTAHYVFIYKNLDTLRHIFIFKKNALSVTIISIFNLSSCVLWYLTINVCTIRAIRAIDKFELFIENLSYSYDK